MNVHVYLNKIKRDLKPLFIDAVLYFKRHGVPLSFTFEECDIKNLEVIEQFIRGTVPLKGDITILMYEFDDFPVSRSYCIMPEPKKPLTYILSSDIESKLRITELAIKHELMHAIRMYLGLPQSKDVMDTYYKNTIEEYQDPDSNFEQQWRILQPYLHQLMEPQVTIYRHTQYEASYGNLVATNNGAEFKCHTLELGWKDNKNNISCIPKGTYKCKWSRSLKFPLGTYEILNVPNRTGIRFHSGNYALGKNVDIEGCILLGKYFADLNGDMKIDIAESVSTVKAFERFMEKKDFTLVIK